MKPDRPVPKFIEEAFESELDAAEALGAVPGLDEEPVESAPPRLSSAIADRLASEVERVPTRYAPFYAELAELFDLSEDAVERELLRAGNPETWKRTALPSVRVFAVQPGPKLKDADVRLVRFAPGSRFPEHRHRGTETTFLLEGGYAEEQGKSYHAGDVHLQEPGTRHAFRTFDDGPCVAASVLHGGLEFSSRLLRILAKISGDG